jgi:predicted DNA-binding protein
MPESRITIRLTPQLHALVSDIVSQHGRRMSDIMREALELYLGVRPTQAPQSSANVSAATAAMSAMLSDTMSGLTSILAEVSALRERLQQLEGRLDELSASTSQRQPRDKTPRDQAPVGVRKLTPRQVAALRRKRQRGVPIKALIEEYGISKATLFRYLK